MLAKSLGNCVTGIESGEVCGLDSVSTGCSTTNNMVTEDCRCNPGVIGTGNSCRGKQSIHERTITSIIHG